MTTTTVLTLIVLALVVQGVSFLILAVMMKRLGRTIWEKSVIILFAAAAFSFAAAATIILVEKGQRP